MKENWEKPSMIVLLRNKPEETVLGACKIATATSGPTADFVQCQHEPDEGCVRCSATGGS